MREREGNFNNTELIGYFTGTTSKHNRRTALLVTRNRNILSTNTLTKARPKRLENCLAGRKSTSVMGCRARLSITICTLFNGKHASCKRRCAPKDLFHARNFNDVHANAGFCHTPPPKQAHAQYMLCRIILYREVRARAPRPQSAQKGPGRGRPGIAKGPRVSPGASSLGSADGAVHRSAAPCPPTDFLRSTLGARGLSFRVRNGTGRAPPALAADRWAAPPAWGLGPPRALRAAQRAEDTETSRDRRHRRFERWAPAVSSDG